MGVWLPIALADIYTAVMAMIRSWLARPESLPLPKRSEMLASWCLPMLSRSFAAEEKEAAALALLRSVEKLGKKLNGRQQT